MSVPLKTLPLPTSPVIPSVISSPVSQVGHLRYDLPVFPTTTPSGPEVVHVNLSARQAKARGLLTSGTFGQRSIGLSNSASLQALLVNRLQAKTLMLGSTLYALTWKQWVLPSGRLLSRLRASVRRTSETELTGWVTPTSRDWKDSGADIKPRVDGSLRLDQLPRQANLLGWPTAMAHEARLGYQRRRGDTKGSQESLTTVMVNLTAPSTDLRLQGWPTPNTMDVVDRKQIRPSRVATNRKSGYLTEDILHLKALPFPARLTASGMLVTGLLAAMEPGGQLNPGHSRWLLGFPPEWDACAPTATQSTRGKRRNS